MKFFKPSDYRIKPDTSDPVLSFPCISLQDQIAAAELDGVSMSFMTPSTYDDDGDDSIDPDSDIRTDRWAAAEDAGYMAQLDRLAVTPPSDPSLGSPSDPDFAGGQPATIPPSSDPLVG